MSRAPGVVPLEEAGLTGPGPGPGAGSGPGSGPGGVVELPPPPVAEVSVITPHAILAPAESCTTTTLPSTWSADSPLETIWDTSVGGDCLVNPLLLA